MELQEGVKTILVSQKSVLFFFLQQQQQLISTACILNSHELRKHHCSVHPESDSLGLLPWVKWILCISHKMELAQNITCLFFLLQLGFTPPKKHRADRGRWPPVEDVGLPWWEHPADRGRAHGLALRLLLQTQVSAQSPCTGPAPSWSSFTHWPALLPLCSQGGPCTLCWIPKHVDKMFSCLSLCWLKTDCF